MTKESEYHRIDKPRKSKLSTILLSVMTGGVEGTVSKVSTTLHTETTSRAVGTMVTKELEVLTELPETYYTEIKKKYSYLKKIGHPVVPTLRTNSEHDMLLMTDVTMSGKLILIDKHAPLSTFDKPILNLTVLQPQIREMAIAAFNDGNGVVLGSDSYSLVYDPVTKLAKVVLVDIGRRTYIVGNYRAKGRTHAISDELVSRLAEHAIKNYFSIPPQPPSRTDSIPENRLTLYKKATEAFVPNIL